MKKHRFYEAAIAEIERTKEIPGSYVPTVEQVIERMEGDEKALEMVKNAQETRKKMFSQEIDIENNFAIVTKERK